MVRAATVSRIKIGHILAPPFPLSNRVTDVRSGYKTPKIAPTLRQDKSLCGFPNMYRWIHELLLPVCFRPESSALLLNTLLPTESAVVEAGTLCPICFVPAVF
ncbi:hypothetical protein PoB_005309500 [Plakobranchus ocellatus]|uniref:Uncharacterized protein n=1 Tax=Plakobranchus ocellatus TaxID=259542 RepID=A0AAV4C1Q5_9GAST|nr:hypothetical protein PoB_005309500 [Plakobranchus ocellatus]